MSAKSDIMREREVMQQLRECRCVSMFWLQWPVTRWRALKRMEERGLVSVTTLAFPMYRVTIHAGQDTVAKRGEKHE